jgi:TonB family protein
MSFANRVSWVLLAALLCAQAAAAQSSVKEQLSATLIGKTMPLKSTCGNNRLTFNIQGVQIENCVEGSWSIHSVFHIENVELTDKILEISGTREVDTVVATKLGSGLTFPDLDRLILTFQLPGSLTDMSFANTLLAAAFASDVERREVLALYSKLVAVPIPDGEQPERAPSQSNTPKEAGFVGILGPNRPVYVVTVGEHSIHAPIASFTPDPEYSNAARKAKIEGVVVLKTVVNEHGEPERIQVARRLGFGLDEKAVAAVASWKFKPGQKDGQPVAVQIAVEVQFNR